MSDFVFRVSPNVIVSSYAASRLGQFACEYGERFMLVLDPVLRSVFFCMVLERFLSILNVFNG